MNQSIFVSFSFHLRRPLSPALARSGRPTPPQFLGSLDSLAFLSLIERLTIFSRATFYIV